MLALLLAVHILAAAFWVGGMAFAYFLNLMQALGIVMILLFLHLVSAPWRRFRDALDRGALPDAAKQLNQIRVIVAVNLMLGIATLVVGGTGRYW